MDDRGYDLRRNLAKILGGILRRTGGWKGREKIKRHIVEEDPGNRIPVTYYSRFSKNDLWQMRYREKDKLVDSAVPEVII